METIYLAPITYHCSRTYTDDAIPFETDFFKGKCDAFVEGYYIVPSGHSLILDDGRTFEGEMIAPWKPYKELDAVQRAYERQIIAEYEALINELYSEVTE